jgi:hypothetical protein
MKERRYKTDFEMKKNCRFKNEVALKTGKV